MAHLLLSGTGYATAPDAAPLDISGDFELIARVALDDWTPAAVVTIIDKGAVLPNYRLQVNTNGTLALAWYDGASNQAVFSSAATEFAAGAAAWLKASLDIDNGSGQREVRFDTSSDATNDPTAVSWSQLGITATGAVTTVAPSNTVLGIGARHNGSSPMFGKFYRAQIYDGIGGTLVFDADPSDPNTWNCPDKDYFTDKANSAVVTLQGDATLIGDCPSAQGAAGSALLLGI